MMTVMKQVILFGRQREAIVTITEENHGRKHVEATGD
jgi:hypothetical protein